MKKKRKVIAPLAVTAVGALAAGVTVLLRKTEGAAAPKAKAAKPAPKAILRDPAVQETGSYSFISGFQNAATVELTVPFDPGTEFFSVVEEDFLSPSDVSHVALLTSEDYRLQIEYAAYYGGEGWEAHVAHLRGLALVNQDKYRLKVVFEALRHLRHFPNGLVFFMRCANLTASIDSSRASGNAAAVRTVS